MIDTIVLSIPKNRFRISSPEYFTPNASGLFNPPFTKMGSRPYIMCILNPSKSLIKKNGYLPRLTIIKSKRKGEIEVNLKIECSLPKMIYGNNFDELQNINFKNLLDCIRSKLLRLGVEVSLEAIKDAKVTRIDYSKNIYLDEYSSSSMIINELHKASISRKIDIGTEKFRNGGHAIHFHTKTRDIVFYDKVKDLFQSKIGENKALEKHNYIQASLLDKFRNSKDVIRMEVRLRSTREIKGSLKKADYIKIEPTFFNLFNSSISKSILQFYWSIIEDATSHLKFRSEGIFDMAETIKAHYPKLKSKKILEYVGAIILSKEGGSRRLRNFLGYCGDSSSNRKWYRLKKSIKSLKYENTASFIAMDEITKGLTKYEPTQLKDLISQND